MATVCKYFLTNSCRFGDRCRFSHTLPNDAYRSNPYVYDVRQKEVVSSRLSSQQKQQSYSSKDEFERLFAEYMKKIIEDINQIELQHMWPLTCYSFTKNHGNLPGWNDLSMEEVRWEAYQSQINGTSQAYLAKIQELLTHAQEQRNLFLRNTKQGEMILREHLKENKSMDTNENVPFITSQPMTTFSFASAFNNYSQPSTLTQNNSPSGFFSQNIQPTNSFNQVSQTQPTNSFNQVSQTQPTNSFNQVSQTQSINSFNQVSQTQPQLFFGGKLSFESPQSQTTYNAFSNNAPTIQESSSNVLMESSSFNTSPFRSTFSVQSSGQTQNSFGQGFFSNIGTNLSVTLCNKVYSKVDDLSKEDYEAFKANTFTLENLPIALPPKELCH